MWVQVLRNPRQSLLPELLTSDLRKMLTWKPLRMARLSLTAMSMRRTQEQAASAADRYVQSLGG